MPPRPDLSRHCSPPESADSFFAACPHKLPQSEPTLFLRNAHKIIFFGTPRTLLERGNYLSFVFRLTLPFSNLSLYLHPSNFSAHHQVVPHPIPTYTSSIHLQKSDYPLRRCRSPVTFLLTAQFLLTASMHFDPE